MRPRAFFLGGLLAVLFYTLPFTLDAASKPTYADRLAVAQRFAAEQSWSQARAAYSEALALAPEASARRWCELKVAATDWRAEDIPTDWPARNEWTERHEAVFEVMLAPYEVGEQSRDEYWAEVAEEKAALQENISRGNPWALRLAVAEYWGSQRPSPDSAWRYAEFLVRMARLRSTPPVAWREHFERGARLADAADDRALLGLAAIPLVVGEAVVGFNQLSESERSATADRLRTRWADVVAGAKGTRWAALARAQHFFWRLSWGNRAAPLDFPALLKELDGLRWDLRASSEPDETAAFLALDQLEGTWRHRLVSIGMVGVFRPGEPIAFSFGAANVHELRFTLRRHSLEAWARQESVPQVDRFPQNGEVVRAWSSPLGDSNRHEWRSDVVTIEPSLEPGIYTLTTEGVHNTTEPMDRHAFVITSARATVVTVDAGNDVVFAFDERTQAPLAGTTIHGASGLKGEVAAWQATTNAEGRAVIPTLRFATATDYYESLVHVLSIGGQPAVVETRRRGSEREVPVVIDLFFDREIYRPGETVHWKAVVRERRDGRFAIPDARLRLAARLDPGEDEIVPASDFSLTAFGTAHGEFAIPTSARPGEIQISVGTVDAAGAEREANETATLRVENFVPPAINTMIDYPSGPASFRPGHEITVRARVEYFSGGPVVGAPVRCDFRYYRPSWRELAPHEVAQLDAWEKELKENFRAATTDAYGCAEFRLSVPAYLPTPSDISARIVVTPEGGLADETNASVRITALGLIATEGERVSRLAAPGESGEFVWKVEDGFGQPASFRGDARLVEMRWVEIWLDPAGRVVSDAAALARVRREEGLNALDPLPAPWRRLHAGYEETAVTAVPATTDADGRVRATFGLPHAGTFVARLAIGDVWLRPYNYRGDESESRLFVADETTTTLALAPHDTRLVVPDRHRPGEPLRLLAVVPDDTPFAVLTVEGENAIVTRRVDFAGRVRVVTLAELPSAAGAWSASLNLPDGLLYSSTPLEAITVDDPDGGLDVVLETNADTTEARPGAAGALQVRVSDHANNPVKAELAVAISDEAVNQLNGRSWRDGTIFARYDASVGSRFASSAVDEDYLPAVQNDPRPGGQIVASDEETVVLSPFEVADGDGNSYRATATLAGTRLRTELRDVGSAVSVVTADFLKQIGAANTDDLLVYTTATEVGGVFGNFVGKPVVLRQHFASTAFWLPEQTTGVDGQANIEFKYPDNLTQWRVEAYAVGADGNTFARVKHFTRTSLPFQVRLQAPRALVVGDTAEPSALLLNRTDANHTAMVDLQVAGGVSLVAPVANRVSGIEIKAQNEARAAWTLRAVAPGEATFTLIGEAGEAADAMRATLPVFEDGIVQDTAASGRLARGEKRRVLKLTLPANLDRTRTDVSVQLTGSHAAALINALPYLIDYPYGCVEQTMNRFLPAVVVQDALVDLDLLTDLDLDLDAEEKEIQTRLWARIARARNQRSVAAPGFADLGEVVAQSVARLQGAFIEDEGFRWWPGAGSTDLWMTAYVAWGLSIAEDAGVDVPFDFAYDVESALIGMIKAASDVDDRLAWALAAAARYSLIEGRQGELKPAFERAFENRALLSAAGRASLALAAVKFGDDEQRAVLLRNLENGAQRVKSGDLGDTVHWGATGNYWRAMDGAVESTALTLLALLELDPKHPLIEPAVNWLVLNRRSAHWASTRDTAFAILALTKYIAMRGELDADAEVDVFANGRKVQRVKFTRESLLAGDTTITIDPKLLRGGTNTIELRRISGKSPVYAVALASSWARGDAVKPAGHLINVARGFVRQKQEPTLLGTLRITPEPLPADGKSNAAIAGEQVTARVTLNVPNELEYVMVEVPKPAGCEPLNPLSGYDARLVRVRDKPVAGLAEAGTGVTDPGYNKNGPDGAGPSRSADDGTLIYREEHDDRSVFFIDALAAGTWEIVFSLRATTPGNYRALPAEASAMYVPEVRANSDAQRVRIERRGD